MKKIISILVLAMGLGCTTAQNDQQFSEEALAKVLISQNNEEITLEKILENHKGKTTVIEVWASWCGDCLKAMPQFKEIQNEFNEVDYVFLSADKTYEKFQEAIVKHDLKGDHYWIADGMKGEFGKSINLDWIPRYIIVDKTGKVVLYKAIEKDFDKIKEILNTLK